MYSLHAAEYTVDTKHCGLRVFALFYVLDSYVIIIVVEVCGVVEVLLSSRLSFMLSPFLGVVFG